MYIVRLSVITLICRIGHRVLLRCFALIFVVQPFGSALGEEPLPLCALPSISAGDLTLLLDPVEHTPIALLSDPFVRHSMNGLPVVLQTERDNPDATGLPRLRLADESPEFWAQPAVWKSFQRGPDAYSGWGTELRARDWAGLPTTDRRAYRLDPGLRAAPTTTSVVPPGVGSIRLGNAAGSLQLIWNGVAGRVYQVYFTADLSRPFQLIQTSIAAQDGEARFPLPTAGSQGFYRIAEIAP